MPPASSSSVPNSSPNPPRRQHDGEPATPARGQGKWKFYTGPIWARLIRPRSWLDSRPNERWGSWSISLIIHAIALLALTLIVIEAEGEKPSRFELTVDLGAGESDGLSAGTPEVVLPPAPAPSGEPTPAPPDQPPPDPVRLADLPTIVPPPVQVPSTSPASGSSASGSGTSSASAGFTKGGGLEGRSPSRRARLAEGSGGSTESEAAVERGLKWLIAHQRDDGSWRFQFKGAPCDDTCRNPGTEGSSTAATALALLPFYGAGYTHKEGRYAEQVNHGLYYLGSRMIRTREGGDLQEGSMYAQALATIVLCEAYAMSKDENLRPFAQAAVDYIVYAQDKKGGGWRYFAGQKGDTTVTGWQVMALKSASMAGLNVPSYCLYMADKFFDSVQTKGGAAYGYLKPGDEPTTSAVGLLCRMYFGWPRDREALMQGVAEIDKLGPSKNNIYFNYYATQVLYHHGGPAWERWNRKMRDSLIHSQATAGHESGSWHFDEEHGNAGGRLYTTAMALLTLEVYYRYLPLYTARALQE